jgi:hypothetical protein
VIYVFTVDWEASKAIDVDILLNTSYCITVVDSLRRPGEMRYCEPEQGIEQRKKRGRNFQDIWRYRYGIKHLVLLTKYARVVVRYGKGRIGSFPQHSTLGHFATSRKNPLSPRDFPSQPRPAKPCKLSRMIIIQHRRSRHLSSHGGLGSGGISIWVAVGPAWL